MALAHIFEYVKPKSLDEAVEILTRSGPGARVLSGGTDLVGWIRDNLIAPDLLVDIKAVPDLDRLELRDGILHVGARVTFGQLVAAQAVRTHFPILWEAARVVGSVGLRHRATLVGNICSAVPCCDSGAPLLVYEAVAQAAGPAGPRQIPISEWFLGARRTALAPGELAVGVDIPVPAAPSGGCYVKLGRYHGEDLAQASVAVLISTRFPDDPADSQSSGSPARIPVYRVAFGAVADRPRRAARIEALLAGRELTEETVREAQELVALETSPITDVRASREYRLRMCRVMLARGLRAAAERRAGAGPAPGARLI